MNPAHADCLDEARRIVLRRLAAGMCKPAGAPPLPGQRAHADCSALTTNAPAPRQTWRFPEDVGLMIFCIASSLIVLVWGIAAQ